MMSLRGLVAFPLIWGALFLVLCAMLIGTDAFGPFLRAEIELAKIVSAAGCFAAAFAFRPDHHLRRAWLIFGSSTCIFLVRDLTLAPLGFEALGETALLAVRALLAILGNIAAVTGVFMLARTWKVAGLALPGRPRGQIAVLLTAVVIALALAGPAVVTAGRRLVAGDLGATASVASALGDTATLILIAPLLLTALALRGGLFAWPWALITLSCVSWLGYDAFSVLGPTLGLGADASRVAYELFRALACTFACSAGLAQRWIALGRATG